MRGDGGLARDNQEAARKRRLEESRAKGRRASGRSGNRHVTAHGTDSGPRKRVDVSQRTKAPRVVGFASIFTEGRAKRPWRPDSSASRESAAQDRRERQGCHRYGSIGSAGRTSRASTRRSPPKRMGHREMPGPPVSWS